MGLFGGGAEWIVVFLGNPGLKYYRTRHNAGFMAAEAMEKKLGEKMGRLRFRSLTAQVQLSGHKVLLMKPQTFMNLSGEAAGAAARFYKIPPERVIAVSDDVSLPLGKLRIRRGGSSGGHNGLKSIAEHLGTDEFPRIKLGVGACPPGWDMADWVLGVFRGEDELTMTDAAKRAADAVECYIAEGPERTMNKYNGNTNSGKG